MMVETNRKENLKQKYNDFHNNHIFLPYEREEGKKKERKGKGGEKTRRERGQDRQEKYFFFFPFAKRRGNSEVSANNVINRVSLY